MPKFDMMCCSRRSCTAVMDFIQDRRRFTVSAFVLRKFRAILLLPRFWMVSRVCLVVANAFAFAFMTAGPFHICCVIWTTMMATCLSTFIMFAIFLLCTRGSEVDFLSAYSGRREPRLRATVVGPSRINISPVVQLVLSCFGCCLALIVLRSTKYPCR